jgi:ATP-dependent DNA ligase
VKVRRWRSADLVVGGYLGPAGDPWSLLLGVYDEQGVLHHVGQTVVFSPRERVALRARLAPLEGVGASAAMPGRTRWEHQRFDSWVPPTPALVCEVDFSALDGRRFRHSARFIRWRPDKDPTDCTYCELPPL